MQFIQPQFLYGLALLAIPIIIHLFNFRKVKRVYFSNTAFLQKLHKEKRNRRRLKHWLVLFTRLAALAFLIVAFAQPFIPPKNGTANDKFINIYLDNSLSSSSRIDDETTILDEAISRINTLCATFPQGTRFRLLTNNFAPLSNHYLYNDELSEALTEVKYSPIARSYNEIVNRLKTDIKGKQTFWLSDFQRSTFGTQTTLPNDSALQINLIPIHAESNTNIYIDSVSLNAPHIVAHEKNTLKVTLANSGLTDRFNIPVSLKINGISVTSTSADIPAQEKKTVSFDLPQDLDKLNTGSVSLEDFPITFDNEYFFTLKKSEPVKVLDILGEEASPDIASVYADNELFEYTSERADNLDPGKINASDLAVLNGVNSLNDNLRQALTQAEENKSICLIIPGSKPELPSYTSLPGAKNIKLSTDTSWFSFAQINLQDPFFKNIFEKSNEQIKMPKARQVLDLGRQANQKLKLRNGSPFLKELNHKGNILVLCTPLQDRFTDFHNHALFVPTLFKIATHYHQNSTNRLAYSLNENSVEVPSANFDVRKAIKLSREGSELIPERILQGNKIVLSIPKHGMKAGFYDVISHGDSVKNILAFNQTHKESLIDRHTYDDLVRIFANHDNTVVVKNGDTKHFNATLSNDFQGTSLWRIALGISLLLLFSETIILRFLS